MSLEDLLRKEIESEVLSYLTAEDKAFIDKRDALFSEMTVDFSCDMGKVIQNLLHSSL
jgi:hypothetical protein